MSLASEIADNWHGEAGSSYQSWARSILSLSNSRFPAWTISTINEHGVVIPLDTELQVNEEFADVSLKSESRMVWNGNIEYAGPVLSLTSESSSTAFATLCAEFVEPGANGIHRRELVTSPQAWWSEWKDLLGNKNVDQRIYDVLGELCTLKWLLGEGKTDVSWMGPKGATADIHAGSERYEVKSTLRRSGRNVVMHGAYQAPAPSEHRFLVFCRFEAGGSQYSINSLKDEVWNLGYNKTIESELSRLGYEKGRSSRSRCFDLLAMELYQMDDAFPRITADDLPEGVLNINYEIALDGHPYTNLLGAEGGAR